MSTEMQTKVQASPTQNFTPSQTGLLQRKSALCNTPGLVEGSGRDKEKLTLQHSLVDQAGTTTVPHFGHDFSRVSVHSTGPGMIQTKLKINEPGDIYEQEADRVADAVMQMPELGVQREVESEEEERLQAKPLVNQITPLVQRKPDPVEEEEEEKQIQPKSNTGAAPQVTPGIAHDIHSLKGTGQPLPTSERTFFEPRFGRDFSNVHLHTNERAARTSQSINAQAFTLGRDVVFGVGQFSPGTHSGRKLIAHELTHVVQQSGVGNLSLQRSPPKEQRRQEKYPFGSLMWHYRNRRVTARQIRGTLQYKYLRHRLHARSWEALDACRLLHKDISTNDKSKWNKPIKQYLVQARLNKYYRNKRFMEKYPAFTEQRMSYYESASALKSKRRAFDNLLRKRIAPFVKHRAMLVELNRGYISIGCKSKSGLFYKRYILVSKDGKKRVFVRLHELDWANTSLELSHKVCNEYKKPGQNQGSEQTKPIERSQQRQFPWTFVFKRKWRLPRNWRAIGEEVEVRYYKEKKTDGSWCREQYVLRVLYTAQQKRFILDKSLSFEGKMRGDVRIIRDTCANRAKPKVSLLGTVSWEGVFEIMPYGELLRKLKQRTGLSLKLMIKPQIRIVFIPPKRKGNIMRGTGRALMRVAVEVPLVQGMKGELRYMLFSCDLGFFEIGKRPYSEFKLACINYLFEKISLRRIGLKPPGLPVKPVLPPDIVEPTPRLF